MSLLINNVKLDEEIIKESVNASNAGVDVSEFLLRVKNANQLIILRGYLQMGYELNDLVVNQILSLDSKKSKTQAKWFKAQLQI